MSHTSVLASQMPLLLFLLLLLLLLPPPILPLALSLQLT
jgi:hypothetical protein